MIISRTALSPGRSLRSLAHRAMTENHNVGRHDRLGGPIHEYQQVA